MGMKYWSVYIRPCSFVTWCMQSVPSRPLFALFTHTRQHAVDLNAPNIYQGLHKLLDVVSRLESWIVGSRIQLLTFVAKLCKDEEEEEQEEEQHTHHVKASLFQLTCLKSFFSFYDSCQRSMHVRSYFWCSLQVHSRPVTLEARKNGNREKAANSETHSQRETQQSTSPVPANGGGRPFRQQHHNEGRHLLRATQSAGGRWAAAAVFGLLRTHMYTLLRPMHSCTISSTKISTDITG